MDFDVYRDARDRTQFHLHSVGSRCSTCSASPVETRLEMPEDVYQIIGGKLKERGHILMPRDCANSEAVSNWWQLVSLLMQ